MFIRSEGSFQNRIVQFVYRQLWSARKTSNDEKLLLKTLVRNSAENEKQYFDKAKCSGVFFQRENCKKNTKYPLVKTLFTKNKEIAEESLASPFMQGIINGNLDPNCYGRYMVQDAVYCHKATNNLKFLAEKSNDKLKPFFNARFESYKKYSDTIFKYWHINNPNAITLSDSLTSYCEFQRHILHKHIHEPAYFIITMLPCEVLWPWLAREAHRLQDKNSTNLYKFWIDENLEEQQGEFEQYINRYICECDMDMVAASDFFKQCMQGELDFFRSACNANIFRPE